MPLGAHHQASLPLQSLLPLPPPTSQKALSLSLPQKGRNSSRSFTLPLPRPFSGSTADTKEKGAAAGAQTAHVEGLQSLQSRRKFSWQSFFSNPDFTSSESRREIERPPRMGSRRQPPQHVLRNALLSMGGASLLCLGMVISSLRSEAAGGFSKADELMDWGSLRVSARTPWGRRTAHAFQAGTGRFYAICKSS